MPTEAEIKANYKAIHDELEHRYYILHELPKEEFDLLHGQNWEAMKQDLIAEGYITGPQPPRSSHISTIEAIDTSKARPVKIKRVWQSKDYFYDCFVTESVKDQYIAGDVAIGDYVIVHFDDIGEQIVTNKIFKSW